MLRCQPGGVSGTGLRAGGHRRLAYDPSPHPSGGPRSVARRSAARLAPGPPSLCRRPAGPAVAARAAVRGLAVAPVGSGQGGQPRVDRRAGGRGGARVSARGRREGRRRVARRARLVRPLSGECGAAPRRAVLVPGGLRRAGGGHRPDPGAADGRGGVFRRRDEPRLPAGGHAVEQPAAAGRRGAARRRLAGGGVVGPGPLRAAAPDPARAGPAPADLNRECQGAGGRDASRSLAAPLSCR